MLGAGAVWCACHLVRASYGFEVRAQFDSLPLSDEELVEWLRLQPGVVPHTVWTARDGTALRVVFIQVRNIVGHPPFPALEEECAKLGYKGADAMFRDYRED